MDDIRTGHKRTMQDHDEWRMRDVQRAAGKAEADNLAKIANMHFTTVIGVDRFNRVLLDTFCNQDGEGEWFSPANNVRAEQGDYAAWTYLDGNPFVVAIIPHERHAWAAPSVQYYTEMDHFQHGSNDATGQFGDKQWQVTTAGTGTPSFFAHPGSQLYGGGAGWVRIHSGSDVNSYAIMHSRKTNYLMRNVREFEFGFGHTYPHSNNYINIGLSNNFIGAATAFIVLRGDADNPYWRLLTHGSLSAVTKVPVVANHYMSAKISHLEDEQWEMYIRDWDAEIEDHVRLAPADSGLTGMYLGGTIYNRTTGAQRSLDFDYFRWTMMDIRRGALDDEE